MITQPYSGTSGRGNTFDSSDHTQFTHLVFIRYEDNGSAKSGLISVKFEFNTGDLSINYMDVHYSDKNLERVVESNPNMLRNIDSYLRNQLLKLQFNC